MEADILKAMEALENTIYKSLKDLGDDITQSLASISVALDEIKEEIAKK